jgi:hypothetical protein
MLVGAVIYFLNHHTFLVGQVFVNDLKMLICRFILFISELFKYF